MAGFVYEVGCYGQQQGKTIANIYHVWDGNESETPDDVADMFENNLLTDIATQQTDQLVWTRIAVTPLDVGNLANPINRLISITGSLATEVNMSGAHIWVKFQSDDNGFKSGGKLIGGLAEATISSGALSTSILNIWQAFFDDFLTDLTAAGLACAIYRPTLSTPGFPSISICSQIFVRGVGTNNRRQLPFQN